MKSILLVRKLLGLVEGTFGLVYCCLQLARMASCKNDFLCPLLFELICCDLNYKSSFSLLPLTIQENKHILILKRAVSFREGSKTRLRRAAVIKPGGNGRLAYQ